MSLWFETALVGDRWVEGVRITHEGGLITAVEAAPPGPGDERGAIAVPGLCNLHSHAFQRGMAGLAETLGAGGGAGDSFWTWREVMYRFLDSLGPDDVEAIAALAYAEMLEAGFTRVGEFHYLHHGPDGRPYDNPAELADRVAAAASSTGIGLTLLPVFYAHGGFGGAPPAAGQRRFITDLDAFGRLWDGAREAVARLEDGVIGVAPHSLRAATPAEIAEIAPWPGAGPVHIHIAEQAREVADCIARHGAPPVAWLMDQMDIDARWCLVHATHVTLEETAAMAVAGAVVGLCPITEANLGDGLFPAPAFLESGGRIGIGTDSNVLIDLAGELRALEYGQRLFAQGRNILGSVDRPSTGGRLFAAVLAGGAQALGLRPPDLAIGEPLDLVSLDGDAVSLVSRRGDSLLDGWIFASRACPVDGVWRRGRKVVAGGRHIHKADILARYRRVLTRVLGQ